MKFDSLILDIDGTIWNTTPIVAEAWNNAVKKFGYNTKQITAEILKKEFGKPMDVIGLDLWPELDETSRGKILDLCCEQEHIAISKNSSDITYPNVINTIKKLSQHIPVFVVSNCQAGYIPLTLEKNNLTSCVTDFVCFGDNGFSKGQNIELIVKRNNLKNPVYVGDTQGDCDACKSANVPFIWARYGFGIADSFVEAIDDFVEIEKFFE